MVARYLAALSCTVLCVLEGCGGTRVSFATTDFKASEYRGSRIAIFPVVINPEFSGDAAAIPSEALRTAVADQLKWLGMARPTAIDAALLTAKHVQLTFPLTPDRLAAAANQLGEGYDAAIGISVASFAEKSSDRPEASMELFVAFADVKHPEQRKWTLAGSWYGSTLDNVVQTIKLKLGFSIIDLEFYQRNPDMTPLAGGQPYKATQPLLTIASPDWTLKKDAGSVHTKRLSIVATAVHDGGLDRVAVVNEKTSFSRVIFAHNAWNGPEKAIYVSAPIDVPLAFGENVVVITAVPVDGAGVAASRTILVSSDVKPAISFVSFGIGGYEQLPQIPSAHDAAVAFATAATRAGGRPVTPTLTVDASRIDVLNDLGLLLRQAAYDDVVLIYYAGRANVDVPHDGQASVFLVLKDAPAARPALGSLWISDLRNLVGSQRRAVLLDLCVDAANEDAVRDQVSNSLSGRAIAVVGRCEDGVGSIGRAAAKALNARRLLASDGIDNLFADIAKQVPSTIRGEAAVTSGAP